MSSLAGKVALVTGASRGIGQSIAERLGGAGANVVITYAGNREKAEAVVETLRNTGVASFRDGVPKAIAIQSDSNNIASTCSLFQQILSLGSAQ